MVGLDGDHLAAGLYAVPSGYLIPYAQDEDYIPKLRDILVREECQLMFPGLDAELPKLSMNKSRIEEESGCRVIISSPEVIQIADDKLLTARFLADNGFPTLSTAVLSDVLNNDIDMPYPFIIKPRIGGARSLNVYKITETRDLDRILPDIDPANFVAQEHVDGDEYTCGTISFHGKCFGVIAMNRILRHGDTYKCFVEFNPSLEDMLFRIVEILQPFGPLNIQLRIRDNVPYIFEFNARCSGTTAARALSGFNEPKLVADYLLHHIEPTIDIKKTVILRYWNELVVTADDVENTASNHFNKTATAPDL